MLEQALSLIFLVNPRLAAGALTHLRNIVSDPGQNTFRTGVNSLGDEGGFPPPPPPPPRP